MIFKCIDFLLKAEETAIFRSVLCPLGLNFEVVIHTLMPEKHVLVAPVRSGQG